MRILLFVAGLGVMMLLFKDQPPLLTLGLFTLGWFASEVVFRVRNLNDE